MRGINCWTHREKWFLPTPDFYIWPSTSRRDSLSKDCTQCSVSYMQLPTGVRLFWYHQHSCIAEAYKSRERGFQDRKLRHLVTSKAGCNQASGSFLSAVCCSRYTAGCMVGGLSMLHQELMTKTLFWLFILWLLADQKTVRHVHWQLFYSQGFLFFLTQLYSTSGKLKKEMQSFMSEGNLF